MLGNIRFAQRYAEEIKSELELEDFRFVRLNGVEAFLDNDTIRKVNKLNGETLFIEREETEINRLYGNDDPALVSARSSGEIYRIIDDAKQQYKVLTPILSTSVCQ
ncbi:MAG: hypothetical protein ABW107_19830 [Candidatus Thiodiazotropha sp. 6PLUC5]